MIAETVAENLGLERKPAEEFEGEKERSGADRSDAGKDAEPSSSGFDIEPAQESIPVVDTPHPDQERSGEGKSDAAGPGALGLENEPTLECRNEKVSVVDIPDRYKESSGEGGRAVHSDAEPGDGAQGKVGIANGDTSPTDGSSNQVEEEEEEECGFCLFMKAGPCGEGFSLWQYCVEGAERSGADIVQSCAQLTNSLKQCMEMNSEYYGPVLEVEKARGETEGFYDENAVVEHHNENNFDSYVTQDPK